MILRSKCVGGWVRCTLKEIHACMRQTQLASLRPKEEEKMREEGVRPDGITFLIVLNACKYAKLVKKGQKFFEMMSKDYGINPSIEHKNYMADLLRESGKIDDAVEILL